CAGCGALVLRRPVMVANVFALAWIVVLLVNPTDLVSPGCQLSFLATAVLYWGTSRFRREEDPLERLVGESRPLWQRLLFQLGRLIGLSYLANLVIWLAITPLVVGHYHLVPPAALIIGPPLALLTSAALIFGFLLIPTAVVCGPLVPVW